MHWVTSKMTADPFSAAAKSQIWIKQLIREAAETGVTTIPTFLVWARLSPMLIGCLVQPLPSKCLSISLAPLLILLILLIISSLFSVYILTSSLTSPKYCITCLLLKSLPSLCVCKSSCFLQVWAFLEQELECLVWKNRILSQAYALV